ncbi:MULTISPECIES: signal recognition particle-docking protein FtsY [Enterococcus]|uniref:Signal recognition particle receptor FtsY n=1 Tax=Enterococcus dispar ATCC 51266 TaxID=1139219 RepID=S0KDG4_9ENTE|nr:signal recognition particle-docking protein FtsY [Enterococcus dispar]EOT38965.1 signal recognition particle-docking protein FtsY [Enterococcus dispar ATCC 51266]EOW86134.1 signal recognition particle-docking protein FtsY [Enterococcus dispar ATCC 51266]MCU7357053.1 signal recognition particle-docking protein FtsY [Enterococcus dispar]MDT2705157.1 signal recognition particle-docking protein FtsY [Enterococcus dispar]OJG39132.1 signal recognition particle-docking protein FtsY [Enterococcus d
MGFFDKIKKALMGETETKTPEETQEQQASKTATESDSENLQSSSQTTSDNTEPTTEINGVSLADKEKETQMTENAPEPEQAEKPEATEKVTPEGEPVMPETPPMDEVKNSVSAEKTLDEVDDKPIVIPEPIQPESSMPETSETPIAPSIIQENQQIEEIKESVVADNVQEKYDKGLKKSRKTFGQRLNELFANFRSVDEEFFEEVEETLIGADVGFEAAMKIADDLRQEVKIRNVKKPAEVQNVMIEKLVDLYDEAGIDEVNTLNIQPNGLTVMLFVGVNGVGKTTSIGKLAYEYKQAGKKVLLAAADTFRAGAIDQLVVWGQRADVEVIRGNAGGDPAAVVYDAMEKAKEQQADILLVDTAGRLQNKVNLMNELEKIKRVIKREAPDAPHEVLLVLDATTGQNAMVQAKQFKETTDVTGLILTKLDGTAKGGIVLAIRNELHLPVKLVGLGEGIDDLEPFDPNEFIVGLFKGLIKEV